MTGAAVSWNTHRLSMEVAAEIMMQTALNTHESVILLQEAGSWNIEEFECMTGLRVIAGSLGQRDMAACIAKR